MQESELSEELFLPEPLPREVKYTVISVDDHVVEPPHTFEGRLPAHLQDRGAEGDRHAAGTADLEVRG